MGEKSDGRKKRKTTPKVLAARRRKRDSRRDQHATWIPPYLEQLEKHGQLLLAARLVGIDRTIVWRERKTNRAFRVAVAEARRLFHERNVAELEKELIRRAKHKTPGEMDTKALLAALRRFDPANYDRPRQQNLNLGGQPGNQLPAPPPSENSITVIRLVDINSHADAQLFRQMQDSRKVIEERADETSDQDSLAVAKHGNGSNGNGKAKKATRGQ